MKLTRKISLVIVLIALLACIPTCVYATQPSVSTSNQNLSISEKISWLVEFAKDIVNILFFIIIGIVGVLTYLQAKKTIFIPLKAETFKLQLNAFHEILKFFNECKYGDVDEGFDLHKIVYLNTCEMIDRYVLTFFKNEIKINEEKANARRNEIVGSIVSQDFMEKYFELVNSPTRPEKAEKEVNITNPAVILANWQKYEHGMIHYTKKYAERLAILENLASSPLIPRELRNMLHEIQSAVHNNLTEIGKLLNEVAPDLPEKYPNSDAITKADLTWIWNLYNKRREIVADCNKKVSDFISDYLQVDNVLNK